MFEYLKVVISEGKVNEIKCMDYGCTKTLSDEFIILHISNDNNLVNKYIKFKKKLDIYYDEDKVACPYPDCDSFLQKSEESKDVKCKNGHEYCFDCLNPPHFFFPCYLNSPVPIKNNDKALPFKRCPRCKIYIQKLKGCNRMECPNCHYVWCWLCLKMCNYNHYKSGRCKGQYFNEADEVNPNDFKKSKDYFGIHKIFKCNYKTINTPIKEENRCLYYLLMILFWFFGIPFIYIHAIVNFKDQDIFDNLGVVFPSIGIGFTLFVSFEITFTCLITPFVLIAFIYPKFFERLTMFFGIGNYRDESNHLIFFEVKKVSKVV